MSDQERKGRFYHFAAVGALTGRSITLAGLPLACVGDTVTYSDGAQAVIMDGAGIAATLKGAPYALVGSSLSHGDRITETLWGELDAGIFHEDGATTPGGGVLRKATSSWKIEHTLTNAARIGDFIAYRDGSRTWIITGVGIAGQPEAALAVVGSLLDNGDVIDDSPHRKVHTSTLFVPLDEHASQLHPQ
jgi:uncharacterized Zn-binding protein involved in type VI secretion